MVKVKGIRQSCLAIEAQGLAKHLSGNENYPLGNNKELVLTSCNVGSRRLVARLCDQASRQSTAIACFHLDYAE